MNYILLLGAGFSRNWGGWLAQEAFEYLLGCSILDEGIRLLLWKHQRQGGFEATLGDLQEEHRTRQNAVTEATLAKLEAAIVSMFSDMEKGFKEIDFDFDEGKFTQEHLVRRFLGKFDSIFTLNQDLLLERYYMNIQGPWRSQWTGQACPGMAAVANATSDHQVPYLCRMSPDEQSQVAVGTQIQPVIKLHGSSNWFDRTGARLLVMGNNKSSTISGHLTLSRYQSYWNNSLCKTDTRLMVIGYSFSDAHVNQAIMQAAGRSDFKMFVIDPLGVEVFDENRKAYIYSPGNLAGALQPRVIGASRRSLREIFGSDRIEYAKVMRFFE